MTPRTVYEWQPSTSEIASRAGIPVGEVIRFDHNTSPARPPWTESVAAASVERINEYPAADYTPLRAAIADYHGVSTDQVVPGAGADELIMLSAKAFLKPGDQTVADLPAYPLYRIATEQHGAAFVGIERDPSLAFPVARTAQAAAEAAVTWLCVPHNPVGDRPSDDDLSVVRSAAAGVVVIDAAYAEFTGDRWAAQIDEDPDLVVVGTMSKAFGLAGIRVGYALTSLDRAASLNAVRPPGSVSTMAAEMAITALEDRPWMHMNVQRIIAARADLDAGLRTIGLTPLPSVTNFLLTPVTDAHAVERRLMERGIVVRKFPTDHALSDHLRFTVRTTGEHERLVAELEEALA